MIAAGLAVLLSAALGYAALAAVAPGNRIRTGATGFAFALGLGLAMSSGAVFGWVVLRDELTMGFVWAELLLFGALLAVARAPGRAAAPVDDGGIETAQPGVPAWLVAATWIVVTAALAQTIFRAVNHPYGGWDAWSHWNMRAHFLLLTGAGWRDSFLALEGWHGDYPLLVSSLVARVWTMAGGERPGVGAIVGIAYAAATVGLLYGAVATYRGRTQGLVAGLALLATPYFGEQTAAQHSDIPLSFFILSALVLLAVADRAARPAGLRVLAGFAAACAAWTKNEGIVFLLVLGVVEFAVWAVHRPRSGLAGRLVPVALGVAPVLLMLVYFKLELSPPNFRFSDNTYAKAFDRLLTPQRYAIVARDLLLECAQYKQCALSLVPGFVVYYWLVGGGSVGGERRVVGRVAGVLGLMVVAYFFAYVTTPFDITFDIVFSWNRLVLQVWPAALFAFFLVARVPALSGAPVVPRMEPAGG